MNPTKKCLLVEPKIVTLIIILVGYIISPSIKKRKRLTNGPLTGSINSGLVNAVGEKFQKVIFVFGKGCHRRRVKQNYQDCKKSCEWFSNIASIYGYDFPLSWRR